MPTEHFNQIKKACLDNIDKYYTNRQVIKMMENIENQDENYLILFDFLTFEEFKMAYNSLEKVLKLGLISYMLKRSEFHVKEITVDFYSK